MFSTCKSPFLVVLISAIIASTSIAQQPQTPSQRFSPERNVPPSVHIPDGASKRLPGHNQPQSTSYNFSDTPVNAFRQPTNSRPNTNSPRGALRQVAYQEEVEKQKFSGIPAVLRGTKSTQKNELKTGSNVSRIQDLRPPQSDTPAPSNTNGIVVDQNQFKNHEHELQQRLAELKKLRRKVDQTETANPTSSNQVHQANFPEQDEMLGQRIATANGVITDRQAGIVQNLSDENTATEHIRQVSAESETFQKASVDMSTPGIRVQSFGPNAIGINKIATYKVSVTNDSNQDAEQLQIGVGLPDSVELQNIIVSAGHHEITDGIEKARLNWTIERLPANTSQTISVNVIPRSADPFDMEVNWTIMPKTAATQIRVTEPKLEMKISGPTEVQFGEKATYDVSIVNPGTGDAEQVSVMLPEELGGERANIGTVPAGNERRFKVELLARTAGQLNLAATAVGEGEITASANHDIMVRRANLNVEIAGPPMKYAGSIGQYTVTITNDGDATASDVAAVLAMPNGVKYLGGIDNIDAANGGLKWTVGTLTSGNSRTYKINCQLDASGQLVFQAGARGAGDLAATSDCQTKVDTIADLTLDVEDPKGPLPTGEDVTYKIVVRNRGTRSANSVDLVMQFSEGIEPVKADGYKHKIVTGQVIFAPITRIEPGQQVVLNVMAQALKSGTHIFRAQLTCDESDSREIGEGTTRFFGDDVETNVQHLSLPSKANTADASGDAGADTNDFK